MNFYECLRVSFRSIVANKMRSALTMLGIIIGISAVITMVAIGEGATASVTTQINGLGSNLLIVSPGQASQGPISFGRGSLNTLTMTDVEAIKEKSSVSGVAPVNSSNGQLVWKNKNYATSVEGTTEAFPTVRNVAIAQGRFFNRIEVDQELNVAVLGTEVVTNLFGTETNNVVGQTVLINQLPFTVIGVLQSSGSTGMTNNDDKVIVPITTLNNRLTGDTHVRTIYVSAVSNDQMELAQYDISEAIRASHNLSLKKDNDFQITSQSDILSTAEEVSSVMTTLLSGIAAISLIVGGIGIMNIMLVSVTERTREIGIRKAIGAKRKDILLQFLIESVSLCLMGGLIGIILGIGVSVLINKVGGVSTSITVAPMIYAFLSSMLVGVVFGVYPARKAAMLKPIDALRYE